MSPLLVFRVESLVLFSFCGRNSQWNGELCCAKQMALSIFVGEVQNRSCGYDMVALKCSINSSEKAEYDGTT